MAQTLFKDAAEASKHAQTLRVNGGHGFVDGCTADNIAKDTFHVPTKYVDWCEKNRLAPSIPAPGHTLYRDYNPEALDGFFAMCEALKAMRSCPVTEQAQDDRPKEWV